jgi:hypothetical protein
MSYKKRGVSHYDEAVTRLAALKSIDQNMDLGNGLTVAIYETGVGSPFSVHFKSRKIVSLFSCFVFSAVGRSRAKA